MLAEEAEKVQGGYFSGRVVFQDDEYVKLQSPGSRNAGYLRRHWKEYVEVSALDDKDPAKAEWLEQDMIQEHIHCIVDWLIYRPDGTKYPVPTEEDDSGWWAIMEDERALIIAILQEYYYKPRDEAVRQRLSEQAGDDPKAPSSGNGSEPTAPSRPRSKVSVLTR